MRPGVLIRNGHLVSHALRAGAVIGLAVFAAGPAMADPVADPVSPTDPLIIEPAPPPGAAVPPGPVPAPTAAQQTKSNPMGSLVDLLGAAAAGTPLYPAAPQGGPSSDPLASVGLLMPQNFGMPTGDQPSPYALGENTPSPFARIDAYQGVYALLHSALGRMPGDQLGQPLPGTAPPAGTALPPGLMQNLPAPGGPAPAASGDPAGPPPADPAAPAVPLLPEAATAAR